MDTHFVCSGSCVCASPTEKSCESAGCTMNGQPMGACDCGDIANHDKSE